MGYDHDHPERCPLPSATMLGGDPEPMCTERFEDVTHTRAARVRPKPRFCPLAEAGGHRAPCEGGSCPFFCVPGTRATCAVEAWAPGARHDPVMAAWFIARREDAARSVGDGDPYAIRLHTLATPGPGD